MFRHISSLFGGDKNSSDENSAASIRTPPAARRPSLESRCDAFDAFNDDDDDDDDDDNVSRHQIPLGGSTLRTKMSL